jgi:UDP-N-acetylglucosamine 4,6-dehydratase
MAKVLGKRVLIFGGTGSLGRALIGRWGKENEVGIFSRDEAKHWTIKNQESTDSNLSFFVGDIRDPGRIRDVLREFQPEIVVIAAALKQVDTCESAPTESIKTNILGVGNVVDSCVELRSSLNSLECVLMVSTDKACSPTNVYGMSKALAERIVVSQSSKNLGIKFLGVRYGNVLDSRGSIVPLFRYQAQFNDHFTITDSRMTRFLMTLDESIDLIEDAISRGENGDFWVPRLRSMKIVELAEIFSYKYGKNIREIGIRPGEKLHEELVSTTESLRAFENDKRIILKPVQYTIQGDKRIWSYSSESENLTKAELEEFLDRKEVFSIPLKNFVGRDIEEIRTSESSLGRNK